MRQSEAYSGCSTAVGDGINCHRLCSGARLSFYQSENTSLATLTESNSVTMYLTLDLHKNFTHDNSYHSYSR